MDKRRVGGTATVILCTLCLLAVSLSTGAKSEDRDVSVLTEERPMHRSAIPTATICTGAVYVDGVHGVFYTLDNITDCPDKGIVDFILANRDEVGLAVFDIEVPEDDLPAGDSGSGRG